MLQPRSCLGRATARQPPLRPPGGPRRRHARRLAATSSSASTPASLPPFPPPGAPAATVTAWERDATRTVAKFMLPTAAMPLADPLLSLVDTAAVGRTCPPEALAALAPNIQVFTFWGYLLSGLTAAALREVSGRLAEGDGLGADRLASAAVALAMGVGLVAGGLTLSWGRAMLAATGASKALTAAGLGYCRVRAAGTPLVLTAAVCQALLLARGQPRAPLAWAGVQVAANVAGDAALVWGAGWGLTGAAAATVAAQAIGTAGLARAVCAGGAGAGVPSVAGMAAAFRPLAPGGGGASPAAALLATVLPITAVYALKMGAYWLIQGAAASLPVDLLAAHVPVFAAWNLAAFALTPLEAAAVRFCLKDPNADPVKASALIRVVLVRCGGALGLAGGLAAAAAAAWGGPAFRPPQPCGRSWPPSRRRPGWRPWPVRRTWRRRASWSLQGGRGR